MRLTFLQKVIDTLGVESQKKKAVEELAELQVEIMQQINGKGSNAKVIDELADVIIMTQQLKLIYGHDKVDKRIRFKTARLKKRLEWKRK